MRVERCVDGKGESAGDKMVMGYFSSLEVVGVWEWVFGLGRFLESVLVCWYEETIRLSRGGKL